MFESVKPKLKEKTFLKKISLTFLMLYMVNIDISTSVAKIEAKWWKI